jgi:hypothetical protein
MTPTTWARPHGVPPTSSAWREGIDLRRKERFSASSASESAGDDTRWEGVFPLRRHGRPSARQWGN